ncbi:exosortase E/protease, VPEID-CTERM system [Ruegeria pomeroyi]|uniref:exosortase E/protease, VPEID-CTERM system n=1 Tax=Ruegeria pomeroyi TaxID=89184 RepID=UPI0003006230|nr:exosortase E/protease, VPEID-CTERM system [Ruegeria pomeroyi]NVL02229.1 exosortase E/protease, VPEID-CTERM system [Ruegeria pomeroyi]QWV09178.1 exosortase E/protease, VPEID-CTERM system [Ruegeria pomeroyi]
MRHQFYKLMVLFALEMLAIVLIFQVFSSVECRLTGIETACRALRSATIRILCVGIGLGLFIWFRPNLRRRLVTAADTANGEARRWWAVHLIGLGLIFVPWLRADSASLNADFQAHLVTLLAGAVLAAIGALFLLVPRREMSTLLRDGGGGLALVVLVAALIPDLADALAPLWWAFRGLILVTFYGVAVVLAVLGFHVVLSPETATIGTEGFFVEMAGSCSGIEGFALTAGFFAIYSVLMRDTLRLGRFWLIVFPLALLVSWLFNVLRIAVLIMIGARISPELAVNGFHSFAGWLFFTVLALGVIWVVQARPALHREAEVAEVAPESGARMPFREDPAAALIAPFIVFMLSGLLVQSLWQAPAQGYPLQAALMAAVLWLFRKPLLALDWRLDPVALLGGAVVGVGWILSFRGGPAPEGVSQLTGAALTGWVLCRVLGTTLLVPVIEEGFFRGYLLQLLGGRSAWQTALAVGVTSLAFALLHGRVIEAGLAGLIFAGIALRRGRLGDAILAHAVANGLIALTALLTGDWSLI